MASNQDDGDDAHDPADNSDSVVAGHHEKGEGPMLAAKPGQIVIVYYWPCANADDRACLVHQGNDCL